MPTCPSNLTVWNSIEVGTTETKKDIFSGTDKSISEALLKEAKRRNLGELGNRLKEFVLNKSLDKEHLLKIYDLLIHIYNNPGLCNTFLKPSKLTPDNYGSFTNNSDLNASKEIVDDIRSRINVLENDCMQHNTAYQTGHCIGYYTGYQTGYRTGHCTSHCTSHNTSHCIGHHTSHNIDHRAHNATHQISYCIGKCPLYRITVNSDYKTGHNIGYCISDCPTYNSGHDTSNNSGNDGQNNRK